MSNFWSEINLQPSNPVLTPLDMIVKDSLITLKTFKGTYYSHFQISCIHFGVLFPAINQKLLVWAIQALQNKLFSTSAWRGSLPSTTCPHLWLRLGRAHSLVISLSLTTSASYQKRRQIAFILNKIIIIKKVNMIIRWTSDLWSQVKHMW